MSLGEELQEEIDSKIDGFASILKYIKSSNLSLIQKVYARRYAIISFYALWETFVKNSFRIYLREINSLGLLNNQFHEKMLINSLSKTDGNIPFSKCLPNFNKKCDCIKDLNDFLSEEFELTGIGRTKNINCDELNKILDRYNLDKIQFEGNNRIAERAMKEGLNKLLFRRQLIAHGTGTPNIEDSDLEEINSALIFAMYELSGILVKGYSENKYLRN